MQPTAFPRIFLFALFIFSAHPGSCEPGDRVLDEIKSKLPGGWEMRLSENELVFERTGDCWVKMENKINAPFMPRNPEQIKADFMQNGTKVKASLIFKAEKKWTPERLAEMEKANDKLMAKIRDLPEKFGVSHLFNARLSRKGGDFFTPKTPEDAKKLELYQAEKEKLQAMLMKEPEYTTETLSLFLLRRVGVSDDMHSVFPEEASTQAYAILNLLAEICEERK